MATRRKIRGPAIPVTFRPSLTPMGPVGSGNVVMFADCLCGDLSEFFDVTGSIVSSVALPGGKAALEIDAVSTATAWTRFYPLTTADGFDSSTAGVPTSYVKFDLTVFIAPTTGEEDVSLIFNTSVGVKAILLLTSGRHLQVNDSTNTLVAVGTTALTIGREYRIEWKVGTGTTAPLEVRIDGVTEISASGNTTTSNAAQVIFGKLEDRHSQSVEYRYRNLVWCQNAYPGPCECALLTPAGDGAYTSGTATGAATKWGALADVPTNGDSSYVDSFPASGVYSATLTHLAPTAGVLSVKSQLFTRYVTASEQVYRLVVSAGNSATSAPWMTTAAYTCNQAIVNTDPGSGGSWTDAAVNAAQIGFQSNASIASNDRWTSGWLHVLYVPKVDAPTTGAATGAGSAAGRGALYGLGRGAAVGSSAAAGLGGAYARTTGSAVGSSAAAGLGGAYARATGSAVGSSAAAGLGGAYARTTGAAVGLGSAHGVGTGVPASVGRAVGSSAAHGLAAAAAGVTGHAAGSSSARGLGITGAVGAATGSSSARALTAGVSDTTGAAVGLGSAAGLAAVLPRQSCMVVTDAAKQAFLGDVRARWQACQVALIADGPDPDQAVTWDDLTEVSFAGYTRLPILKAGSIYPDFQGSFFMTGNTLTWVNLGTVAAAIAGVAYITADTPPTLMAYGRRSVPFLLEPSAVYGVTPSLNSTGVPCP